MRRATTSRSTSAGWRRSPTAGSGTTATRTPSTSRPTAARRCWWCATGSRRPLRPQIAAQVAAEVAGRSMSAGLGGTGSDGRQPSRVVTDALAEAAQAVSRRAVAAASPERDAPSCTVVAALWDGVDVTVGWAGDSRAYWLDADGLPPAHRRPLLGRGGGPGRTAEPSGGRGRRTGPRHHPLARRRCRAAGVPGADPAPGARRPPGRVHRRALELPAARRRPGARR